MKVPKLTHRCLYVALLRLRRYQTQQEKICTRRNRKRAAENDHCFIVCRNLHYRPQQMGHVRLRARNFLTYEQSLDLLSMCVTRVRMPLRLTSFPWVNNTWAWGWAAGNRCVCVCVSCGVLRWKWVWWFSNCQFSDFLPSSSGFVDRVSSVFSNFQAIGWQHISFHGYFFWLIS